MATIHSLLAGIGLGLALPYPLTGAWDEEQVIAFIMAYNPILRTYHNVTDAYAPESLTDRIYHYTELYANLSTRKPSVGARIAIPLPSPTNRRQFQEKLLGELSRIDKLRKTVLGDIAGLRQTEAELEASRLRQGYWQNKSVWMQDRVNQGFEDINALWDVTRNLNEERTMAAKLRALLKSHRRQLASHAGDEWRQLQAYLEGRAELDEPKVTDRLTLPSLK